MGPFPPRGADLLGGVLASAQGLKGEGRTKEQTAKEVQGKTHWALAVKTKKKCHHM